MMDKPLEIVFHGVPPSEQAEAEIRDHPLSVLCLNHPISGNYPLEKA
jgi:hypothetical protein